MSDVFGDLDDDDVWGTEPADPEQVAIRLQALRREHDLDAVDWGGLTNAERLVRITVVALLLEWGRRQGVFR